MRPPELGLSDKQREASIRTVDTALCNEMLLLIKTKKARWDVVGPQFLSVRALLEEQDRRITALADALAARVRVLGGYPVGTAAGFIERATLREQPGALSAASGLLHTLLVDHEAVVRALRDAAARLETVELDRGTSEVLLSAMRAHEEMAWSIRSLLEGEPIVPDGEILLPAHVTPSLA